MITLQERVHGTPPPADWQTNKLRNVLRVRKGTKNTGMQEDNLLSLSYGRIIRKDIDANEGLLPESFETYQIVEPGNIVMRLTDLQNDKRSIRQALVTERGIITSAYDAVEVAKDHDARFWAYALLALDLAKYYYSLGAGVRQSIKFADFPNDWIRTPNRETQKSIADFLDYETARINQLIEKKQRQATTLAEREEAAFLNVVTGRNHSGPRGHSGVDWIGDIPVHWSAPKFTYVARQETGHTPSRKEPSYWVPDECTIPWFSLADVWQIRNRGRIYVSETAEKISQVGMENSAARLLPRHTVILSRTASVGFPAVLDVPMAVTQDFVGWICGPQVRPKFLYYVLRSMKPVFRRLMMGSTHQTIYMPDVRAFRLPLPPLHEQDEIITELDRSTGAFRSAAAKITESVGKLREYRSSLITAAVTGWIDIPKNLPVVVSVPDRERFRLIVGAEIIHQHRSNPKFGRVKLQKELYLAEAHLGIRELQGNYCRQAAGPLDRALIDETERLVEAAGFCKTSQADGVGTTVTYTPLGKAGQHNTELKSLLGPRADALGSLINLLRDLGTEAVEAVTTLYAVWNDALIDSRPPDDSTIVNGVLTEWHAEKGKKFKDSDLRHWLDWMKRNGLTPRGKGPRTAHTMTRDMFA